MEDKHPFKFFANFNKKGLLFIFVLIFLSLAMSLILTNYPVRHTDFYRHPYTGSAMLQTGSFANTEFDHSHFFPLLDLWSIFVVDTYHGEKVFYGKDFEAFFTSFKDDYKILNKAAFFFYLLCILLFWRIVRFYKKSENPASEAFLMLPLLACHSIVILSGSTFGDYTYSLFFILLAWFLVLNKFSGLAGIVLALASGFRITNGVWFVPFIAIYLKNRDFKNAVSFALTSIIGGYIVYLGVFISRGTLNPLVVFDMAKGMYGLDRPFKQEMTNAISRISHLIGIPIILYCLIFIKNINLKAWLERIKKQWELIAAFIVMFIAFVRLGDQQGYIITLIPVIAILLPSFNSRKLNIILCAVIFLMNFITISVLNTYPTKVFISHGYWINAMASYKTNVNYQKLRFNLPVRGNVEPVGGEQS